MALQPPRLPFTVRALNAAGSAATRFGIRIGDLGMDTLLGCAARETGLRDFGDAFFREPLSVFLESLESEAALTTLGRISARAEITRGLKNRLYMTDVFNQSPEITRKPIVKPIFILGLPRTGTSILHELLAQDHDNRVPMTWEVHNIWPPPDRATYSRDPRIEQTDEFLSRIDQVLPGFKHIHPMGAQLPQECVALMAHDFASLQFHTTYRVPTYQQWLEELDVGPVYASHRKQLQYLQWKCPAEQWVLKSPGHLWTLDALLDEYPDARDGSDYGPLVYFGAAKHLASVYEKQGRPEEAADVLRGASEHPKAPLALQLELSHKLSAYQLHDQAAQALRRGLESEQPEDERHERLRLRVELARALRGIDREDASAESQARSTGRRTDGSTRSM